MNDVLDFCQYAVKRDKKIQLIYMDEENKIQKKTVRVLEILEDSINVMAGRKKMTIAMEKLLSATYGRGDTGDIENPLSQ